MKTSQQQADELLALWRKGREAGIPPQDRLIDNIFHEPNPFGPGTGREKTEAQKLREWEDASKSVRRVATRHGCSIDDVYEKYPEEAYREIDREREIDHVFSPFMAFIFIVSLAGFILSRMS
jgi:hypothetical protein